MDLKVHFMTLILINSYLVMFHVSVMTNAEQHRRLIGNDIAVIVFHEDSKLDPTHLNELGTVPQVFAVVHPIGKSGPAGYR